MSMNPPMVPASGVPGDAQLVERCLAGDHEAFGRIVARYQSLICSLTYSACGNLGRSEEQAQEVFLTAWQRLDTLRKPANLKAWLCGIARRKLSTAWRHDARDPLAEAEPLVDDLAVCAESLPASEQMIRAEEEEIVWRALEGLPPSYREPLVLYYRQDRSTAEVAEAMDISEEAARQRLTRARTLLNERVREVVEGVLSRSAPGKAFTLSVLAAMPVTSLSTSAAALGPTAAKISGPAKAAAGPGLLGALLGPAVAGLGVYLTYRASLDDALSEGERRFVRRFYQFLFGATMAFLLASAPLIIWGGDLSRAHPALYGGLASGLMAATVTVVASLILWSRRQQKRLTESLVKLAEARCGPAWEYRSRVRLLHLPLLHIRLGGDWATRRQPVKAWIAVGDVAYGAVFAFGGVAVAPLCIGGLAVGLVAMGGLASGLVGFGALSVGVWAVGGCALGWYAFGGCAVAWKAALGAITVAHDFALGGGAYAAHANDSAAKEFMRQSTFFPGVVAAARYSVWLQLLWILPLCWWWRMLRRARIRNGSNPQQQPADSLEPRQPR